jgi:hypothetical protein
MEITDNVNRPIIITALSFTSLPFTVIESCLSLNSQVVVEFEDLWYTIIAEKSVGPREEHFFDAVSVNFLDWEVRHQ